MILVQDIVNEMASSLDAEGSDHYTFDRDYKPSINRSARWLTHVISRALGRIKNPGEIFRDLSVVRIFISSGYSRISLDPDPLGHQVWTIIAVWPKATTTPGAAIPVAANLYDSSIATGETYLSSDNDAARLTPEEWNKQKGNPFADGYEGAAICDELKSYAYLAPMDYSSTNYPVTKEIEIRPSLKRGYVGINYLRTPGDISLIGDSVDFPKVLQNLLVDRALKFVSFKQGDQTNLYAVTDRDINAVLTSIV